MSEIYLLIIGPPTVYHKSYIVFVLNGDINRLCYCGLVQIVRHLTCWPYVYIDLSTMHDILYNIHVMGEM